MFEEDEFILINQVFQAASGGITPPSFISESETAWDTEFDLKTTPSFDVQTGDVLVAFSVMENGLDVGVNIDSTPSLVWTRQEEYGGGSSAFSYVTIWTATATSNTSMTATFDRQGSNGAKFGGNVLVFRGSSGIGASEQNNNGEDSGAPSVNITTTQANSVIVVANGDWNAVVGSPTWLTNAGSLSEVTVYADGLTYGVHGGYHPNAGAINTYAVGISSPSTQRYGIVAVEVKGA